MNDHPHLVGTRTMAALIVVAVILAYHLPGLARMAADAGSYRDIVRPFK